MMTKHTTKIDGRDVSEIAEIIGDLRYDALRDFFHHLSVELEKDSESDLSRGRKKLAAKLENLSYTMREVSSDVDSVWNLCRPYMEIDDVQ